MGYGQNEEDVIFPSHMAKISDKSGRCPQVHGQSETSDQSSFSKNSAAPAELSVFNGKLH